MFYSLRQRLLFSGTCRVSGTLPGTLHTIAHNEPARWMFPHFVSEKREAQRHEVTCSYLSFLAKFKKRHDQSRSAGLTTSFTTMLESKLRYCKPLQGTMLTKVPSSFENVNEDVFLPF